MLEAKWKAVNQDLQIPDFTAAPGIKVQLPDEASEFFDLLVTQKKLVCFAIHKTQP